MNPRRRTIKWEEEEDKASVDMHNKKFSSLKMTLICYRKCDNRKIVSKQHLIAKLNHGMKWYIIVFAEFKKDVVAADGTITEQKREDYLSSQTFTAYNQTDIDMDLPTAYKDLFTKFDEQERQGSGWYLSKIIHIEVHTATLSPLAASSYIELPKKVKRTKAVINIKNEDNMCFIWSVLAHLHPIDKCKQSE